jgi:hypothetical protein
MRKRKEKKTDNSNLSAKLALRRYFLRKYHADGSARVLDCTEGEGIIWNRLRKEGPVQSYLGLDKKERRGGLTIDSRKVLANPRIEQDVIDIDTYGSPWKHVIALMRHRQKPVTVFLTFGDAGIAGPGDAGLLDLLGMSALITGGGHWACAHGEDRKGVA